MGDWWRKEQQQHRGPTRRPPRYGGRPPQSNESWCQTVPSWEKKFCTTVCSIPWWKLCETKKLMYMYETVVQWDDSAGEEAFNNAKARYWAQINGFDCDIPLPDPDKYIDVVNQNTIIDPELVEDLYAQPPVSDCEESGVNWDSFLYSDKPVPVSGWGDEDEPDPINDATKDGAAQYESTANCKVHTNSLNASDSVGKEMNGKDANDWSQNAGWGNGIMHGNSLAVGEDSSWGHRRDNSGEIWEKRNKKSDRIYDRKRDGGSRFGSRYMKSGYYGENCQTNNNWRNWKGGNRTNYSYEQSVDYKSPLATQQ